MDRLLWLLCIVGPDALPAEPPGGPRGPSDAKEHSSEIVVLEPGPHSSIEGAGYVDAIRDHAASSQVEVTGASLAKQAPLQAALDHIRATPVLGVFWLSAKPDSVSIFLLHARTQAVYVRELPRDESGDAALVEMVGLIVVSTAVALRDGQDVQMRTATAAELALLPQSEDQADPPANTEADAQAQPEPDPRSEPAPSADGQSASNPQPVRPPTPTLPAVVHLGYLGDAFNRHAPWQSGVVAALGVELGKRWQVRARYGWLAASAVAADDALRVARHEVGLATQVGGDVTDRVRLAGQLSAAAEFQRWRLEGGSGSRVRGRVGPGVVLGVDLGAGFGFEASLEGMVALNTFSFVRCASAETACEGANRAELGRAWRIAPRATLGITYSFSLSPPPATKK